MYLWTAACSRSGPRPSAVLLDDHGPVGARRRRRAVAAGPAPSGRCAASRPTARPSAHGLAQGPADAHEPPPSPRPDARCGRRPTRGGLPSGAARHAGPGRAARRPGLRLIGCAASAGTPGSGARCVGVGSPLRSSRTTRGVMCATAERPSTSTTAALVGAWLAKMVAAASSCSSLLRGMDFYDPGVLFVVLDVFGRSLGSAAPSRRTAAVRPACRAIPRRCRERPPRGCAGRVHAPDGLGCPAIRQRPGPTTSRAAPRRPTTRGSAP